MTVSTLMLGMIFGCLGMGYWIYGRKTQLLMPLVAGAALMIYPYFLPEVWQILIVGILLCAVPFFIRI